MQRPQADRDVLERYGRRARVYEVHGDLLFAGAESVVREIAKAGEDLELLVLDVRRIGDVADVARRLLASLRKSLLDRDCDAVLVDPDGTLPVPEGATTHVFPTIMAATVWCEDKLLERYGEWVDDVEEELDLRRPPAAGERARRAADELERRMVPREYRDGELIVEEGDADAGVFLIMSGRVRSSLTTAAGVTRQLAQLTPGPASATCTWSPATPHPLTMHAVGHVAAAASSRATSSTRSAAQTPGSGPSCCTCSCSPSTTTWTACCGAFSNGRVTPMTSS